MVYFVSYDITVPKRLAKIAKILSNFGLRVQYSFFECEMEKQKMELLKTQILENMDLEEDSLRIYPLCEDCLKKASSIGNGNIFIPTNFQIL